MEAHPPVFVYSAGLCGALKGLSLMFEEGSILMSEAPLGVW